MTANQPVSLANGKMEISLMSSFVTRRKVLRAGALAITAGVGALSKSNVARASVEGFGPLLPADENGLRLPEGFSSRIVAQSGSEVGTTGHVWHAAPDGGATFATGDGGWLYVSNAEGFPGSSGVGVIRFASDGSIADAYSILTGTWRNCAGGTTPWGTWLSCEEISAGRVYECDPYSPGSQGIVRPALGVFNHEAAVVDPIGGHVYLSEDRSNGLLYRFTPNSYPDLSSGILEAAEILDPLGQGSIAPGEVRPLDWHQVPDPSGASSSTRHQVPAATSFNGGEGLWYEGGSVILGTKGDNRVWRIDLGRQEIEIVYDFATAPSAPLTGVDNVLATSAGDIFVAEDGGDMQIVAITPSGEVNPFIEISGVSGSEVTGPALSPDGTRMYFSSQRNPGTTYEVAGDFLGATPVPFLGLWGQVSLLAAAALVARRSASPGETSLTLETHTARRPETTGRML